MYQILTLTSTLFVLMDALGNVPLFISLLRQFPPAKQRWIILRELLIALAVMLLFSVAGEFFLSALHISSYAVSISGGIILFLIALRMIFPSLHHNKEWEKLSKEPFIVPLAIPFVAGPAVLAAIIIYSKEVESFSLLLLSIFLAWLATTILLISSSFLKKILGDKGIAACEKLMGLILVMISVQMFLGGIAEYTKVLH